MQKHTSYTTVPPRGVWRITHQLALAEAKSKSVVSNPGMVLPLSKGVFHISLHCIASTHLETHYDRSKERYRRYRIRSRICSVFNSQPIRSSSSGRLCGVITRRCSEAIASCEHTENRSPLSARWSEKQHITASRLRTNQRAATNRTRNT